MEETDVALRSLIGVEPDCDIECDVAPECGTLTA